MPSLDQIIADFGRPLGRVASSYEADLALREDLMQDILLAIHRALPTLRETDRLAPFVFKIAHNRGVSHVARRMALKRAPVPDDEPDPPSAEQALIEGERSSRLVRAVRRLPLPYRETITLVLEDLSYAEIAETLDISVSNVGVRVNRAKVMLKEMLSDD
jgi:RNA polymerase sigma factor (sigma-70 family)